MHNEDLTVVWAFAGALFMVKFVTSIMILYYFPSWTTFMLLILLSIAWFIPPLFYLMHNPKGRYRLWRARVRRRELLRQEWHVENRDPSHRL